MHDDRVMGSGPDFGTSKGRGQKSGLCPLQQRPIGSFFRIKSPLWQALFGSLPHPLLILYFCSTDARSVPVFLLSFPLWSPHTVKGPHV